MTTPRNNHPSSFGRRRLLRHAATGAAALAITTSFVGSIASAGPSKADRKKMKQALARARAQTPGKDKGPADLVLTAEERELADALLAKARHSVAIAASSPGTSFATGSTGAAAAKFLKGQRATRVARAKTRAAKMLADRNPAFGAFAGVDAKVHMHADAGGNAALQAAAKKIGGKQAAAAPEPPKNAPVFERIEFHLNSVECIEETDEVGSDEILLGGHLILPNGEQRRIQKFKVSDTFDQGDAKHYDYDGCQIIPGMGEVMREQGIGCFNGGPNDLFAGRKLISSKLDGPFPATYGIVLLMGEEDTAGGFTEFLEDTYKALESEIDTAFKAAGVAVGTAVGSFLPGIGNVVGAAIAAALGELADWIVGLVNNKDDKIASRHWTLRLKKADRAYIKGLSDDNLPAPQGTWASPMKRLDFKGDGGFYRVRMHWRAVA